MSNFAGKVVLVTGGAHGIGKGIAKQFADRGAHTVIVDYNEENGKATAAELTFGDVKSLFIKTDVSDPQALVDVREKVFATFGRIDVLILNAGVAFANKVNNISFEEWNKTIAINLSGLFNTVKAFYDDFLTNKGSIVYISSGSALSGTGGGVSYPASKAGGEGLIRGLDLDAVLEKIPVRRLGTIDDVANLAIFLADKDNSYIQGQTILMDGGRTIA